GPDELRELQDRGRGLLSKVVVIKLNGGRSTTMGGEVPKGILKAKNGLSYLEIIGLQMQALQEDLKAEVPLVLMNSFFTDGATRRIMSRFPISLEMFMQSKVPRLVERTLEPLDTGTEDDWAPPGHGDVYETLKRRGLLDRYLKEGKRWAFISNLDNLAACLEPWILGLIDREQVDFLLEVTDRTEVDRKGGTLVNRDGRLYLLEIAQVDQEDWPMFMDIDRFPVFNTNNVWIDLEALRKDLEDHSLALPVILNRKTVKGTRVIQLETAMGAVVSEFPRARGLRVDRSRFFPTKKVEDLFLLQSDACVLDSRYRLRKNPARPHELPLRPRVVFQTDFLASALDMPVRFEEPATVSLVEAERLDVSGPVFFERDVQVRGAVTIHCDGPEEYRIKSGSILDSGVYPPK
ncbi:MAG: UTP--glucose-1-phosphate uridylyltransferase, partial [Pseudomonadota bacterium]